MKKITCDKCGAEIGGEEDSWRLEYKGRWSKTHELDNSDLCTQCVQYWLTKEVQNAVHQGK